MICIKMSRFDRFRSTGLTKAQLEAVEALIDEKANKLMRSRSSSKNSLSSDPDNNTPEMTQQLKDTMKGMRLCLFVASPLWW
jgi:arsenate reductase-like glutaredoxin family protein